MINNNNNTNWNQDYYTKKELKNLSHHVTGTFSIDKNGFINVNGSVHLHSKNLTEIPFKFGKITGYFNCSFNKLTSLKYAPKYVGDNFACSYNDLASLKYAPRYVGSYFICHGNNRRFSVIEILKCIKVIKRIRH